MVTSRGSRSTRGLLVSVSLNECLCWVAIGDAVVRYARCTRRLTRTVPDHGRDSVTRTMIDLYKPDAIQRRRQPTASNASDAPSGSCGPAVAAGSRGDMIFETGQQTLPHAPGLPSRDSCHGRDAVPAVLIAKAGCLPTIV